MAMIAAALNKTTKAIHVKGYTWKIGANAIYSLIESVRSSPNDVIVVVIDPTHDKSPAMNELFHTGF